MRNSKQRDTILNIVQESCDHPTVDMIYLRARDRISNISLGTVYRNLNLLSEQGLVKKIKVAGDIERFDKTIEMHSHLVCQDCGKVIDIMDDNIKDFISNVSHKTEFKIDKYEVSLLGLCSHCQK